MTNCTEVSITFSYDILMAMSIISAVTCVMAIAAMMYFKFYRSFNYRLILYLLIAYLPYELSQAITITFIIVYNFTCSQEIEEFLHYFTGFAVLYSQWSILLCIAFMTAQIFSMVIFFFELRKAEAPITIACFVLPLIPALVSVLWSDEFINSAPNYIPEITISGACIAAIAIALIFLAWRSLRGFVINKNDNEEQNLLHYTRQSYRTALKESLPFLIYPITSLLWLLISYLKAALNICGVMTDILSIIDGSIGTISAVVFFIHIGILGRRRRNTFRCHARNIPPSGAARRIFEGQRLTTAGSITATHVTDFDPLGEDDVPFEP